MCAIGIVSVLLCALSGCCALYAVRYRDASPFSFCAIGMCAIGHYGQFTVCYRDVCYREVGYRDSERITLCAMGIIRHLLCVLSGCALSGFELSGTAVTLLCAIGMCA